MNKVKLIIHVAEGFCQEYIVVETLCALLCPLQKPYSEVGVDCTVLRRIQSNINTWNFDEVLELFNSIKDKLIELNGSVVSYEILEQESKSNGFLISWNYGLID